jgi:hypothetical protein
MRLTAAVLTNPAKAVYLSSNLANTDFQPLVKKLGGCDASLPKTNNNKGAKK